MMLRMSLQIQLPMISLKMEPNMMKNIGEKLNAIFTIATVIMINISTRLSIRPLPVVPMAEKVETVVMVELLGILPCWGPQDFWLTINSKPQVVVKWDWVVMEVAGPKLTIHSEQ